MQIIVLGMHRSGTSLTTRLINMMGAYFGPESSVGEITMDNPKGFWERPEVFKLNESLLGAKGCSWNDVGAWRDEEAHIAPDNTLKIINKLVLGMDAFRPWVLKDPRLCLTLPVWRPFLEVPVAVMVHRDPVEVALSLQKRDGFSVPKGLALWERYAASALKHTQDLPRIHVQHHALVDRPIETCHTLYQQLVEQGVRRLEMPSAREISAFIDPRLYRSKPIHNDYALTAEQTNLSQKMMGIKP